MGATWLGISGDTLKNQLHEKMATDPPNPTGWPTAAYCDIRDGGASPLGVYDDLNGNIGGDAGDEPDVPVATTGGNWTTSAVYFSQSGLTKFTQSGAGWTTNALVNKILKSYNSSNLPAWALIVSNTASELYVLGNLTDYDWDRPSVGDYFIEDYRLSGTLSPCYDMGDASYLPSPFDVNDILGQDRVVGEFDDIDMGCYESQDTP
jgi:hypothetical protein